MGDIERTTTASVLEQVRVLMPRRPLTLSEAYSVAERQAYKLLDVLDIHRPHVTYDKLLKLPNIDIILEPDYLLQHVSGISRYAKGQWLIVVDKNDIHGRRRFTLAHEFKHIIDHPFDKLVYSRLGYGDEQRQHAHIEALCQHFAACFLMPKTWIKNSWTNGVQDVYNLASLFQVSVSAMDIRLRSLGILDDEDEREVSTYFRRSEPYGVMDIAMP